MDFFIVLYIRFLDSLVSKGDGCLPLVPEICTPVDELRLGLPFILVVLVWSFSQRKQPGHSWSGKREKKVMLKIYREFHVSGVILESLESSIIYFAYQEEKKNVGLILAVHFHS